MRIFYFGVLFFLIISNQSAFGQNWQDLFNRAGSLSDSLDYDSAIFIANLALREAEAASGEESLAVAKVAERLGEFYLTCCRYLEADSTLTRSLNIRQTILGDDHADVATALDRLGRLYTETCRFPEADSCLEKSLAIRKKLFDDKSREMAETYYSLGSLYLAKHQYDVAESLLIKAENTGKSLPEADRPAIAECLDGLCRLYCKTQRLDELEQIGFEALDIYRRKYGKEHPATIGCQNSISILYLYQSRLDEAEQLLNLSKKATENVFGIKHRNMVEILLLLGSVYLDKGEYETSYDCYNEGLSIAEEIFQHDHELLAECMHGLSTNQLRFKGNAKTAEPFMKKSVAISERLYGEIDTELNYKLTDLADIYMAQGRLPEAESLLKRVLEYTVKEDFPALEQKTCCLHSLGSICMLVLEYEKAEKYLEEAVALAENLWGDDNDQTLYIQSSLALVYNRQREFAKAESLFKKIIGVFKEKYGSNNINVFLAQFELCLNYLRSSVPEKAEPLLQKCFEHFDKYLGSNHQKSISALNLLGNANRQMDRFKEAFEMTKTAYDIYSMDLDEYLATESEKDALTYSRFFRTYFDMLITCYFDYDSGNNAVTESIAEVILNFKGRVSDQVFSRKKFLDENPDSISMALQETLRKAKQKLCDAYADKYNSHGTDSNGSIYALDSQVELVNDKLVEHAKNRGFDWKREDIKMSQVVELLPRNSVLIEFFEYLYWSRNLLSGTGHYAAVIIGNNADPAIVDLGTYDEIDAAIGEYSECMYRIAGSGVSPSISDKAEYIQINKKLYQKIWKPIEQYLKGINLVIVAPDDKLNTISFAGLLDAENRYLIENYAIHYLASGRDLLRIKGGPKAGTGLFAIGDPDFDVLNGYANDGFSGYNHRDQNIYAAENIRSSCFALNEVVLNPLPETGKEIESLSVNWQNVTDEPFKKFVGVEATEDIFKAGAPGSRIIHIATHGFYIGDECGKGESDSSIYRYSAWAGENPLLHSGIFLAGANRHGEGADNAGIEDGILSAYEVSTLNLSGTDLVVLSTCESGLGKIKFGEGVYGLSRAFQVAGARTVVSTLWPIMDKASAEMLSQLYNRQDRSLPETLREIQLKKINELREQKKPDHPAIWAPYIILGDWR